MVNRLKRSLDEVGYHVVLLGSAARHLPALPHQVKRVLLYCFEMGYKTFPIVAILSFFIGAVLALQTGSPSSRSAPSRSSAPSSAFPSAASWHP